MSEEEEELEVARMEDADEKKREEFSRIAEAIAKAKMQDNLIRLFDDVRIRYSFADSVKWGETNAWISPMHYDEDGYRVCDIRANLLGILPDKKEVKVSFSFDCHERYSPTLYLEGTIETGSYVHVFAEDSWVTSRDTISHQLIFHYGTYPEGEPQPISILFSAERFVKQEKELRDWAFAKLDDVINGKAVGPSTIRRYDWRIKG